MDIADQYRVCSKFIDDSKGSKIGIYLKPQASTEEITADKGEYCWIGFASNKRGPDDWWLGVDVSSNSTQVRNEIKEKMFSSFPKLKHSSNLQTYYWMEDLRENNDVSKGDWSKLVPALFDENNNEEGERKILDFYVQKFECFVPKALDAIKDIWSEYIDSQIE